MTGDSEYGAAWRASISLKWRMTMTLAYLETTLSMSDRLSSLAAEEVTIGLASLMTAPPSRCMAVSKLIRVRVLGWKNRVDITLPVTNGTMERLNGSSCSARSNNP